MPAACFRATCLHALHSLMLPHFSLCPPSFLPARYFIKLVKRKYKKDVSTDIRALQACAPVSAVCCSSRVALLHQPCCSLTHMLLLVRLQLQHCLIAVAAAAAAQHRTMPVCSPFPPAHPGCRRSCAARPSVPSVPCPPSTRWGLCRGDNWPRPATLCCCVPDHACICCALDRSPSNHVTAAKPHQPESPLSINCCIAAGLRGD